MPIRDTSVLSRLYTPGVGACCLAIADNDAVSFDLTCRGDNIALVTDGSALYSMGDVPAAAAIPMLEARSVLFKTFANIDAFPLVLDVKEADAITELVRLITPTFGGVVLTDVTAPKCFSVEFRLRRCLPIPILDSDQHATGIAVGAALLNALKLVKKQLASVKIVINGAGASGTGTARRLLKLGARNIVLCDTKGALHPYRMENMNWAKALMARFTNPDRLHGTLEEVVRGADVLIGLSAADCVSRDMVRSMADGAIVFALALPVPEIGPEEAEAGGAAIYATGTSIYPNQVRASTVAPAFMRGCLDARTGDINNYMFNAAVQALAGKVPDRELTPLRILPDPLDVTVGPAIAEAVALAACESGLSTLCLVPGTVSTRLSRYLYEGEGAWYESSPQARIQRGTGVEAESLELHRKYRGCVAVEAKIPVRDNHIFGELYSPTAAVAPAQEIMADPACAYDYTAKNNLVAVVSDGSAVLGFGNIGPWAALPVMEGKAMLFKTFGGVEAYPLCLATQEVDALVDAVVRLAPVFGGINLEDIAAPRCFEVEDRLRELLDIPVFHDDQHGTAVVVLAGLMNALRIRGGDLAGSRVVVNGAGAAALAVTRLLVDAGARDVVVCDRTGALYRGRKAGMNRYKADIAARTNPDGRKGKLADVIAGADIFLGLSSAGTVSPAMVRSMAADPIVFALANPVPEILPDEASEAGALIVATGRSDFPNQVNNCLAFPGIFRGALDVRARRIDEGMKLAAAQAIASAVPDAELSARKIIPAAMDFSVPPRVAGAVARAALESGVARLRVDPGEVERRLTEYIYEERLVRE
ncbi:MAG: NADP-dependent malic enzyme [Deltaproteobacteria bacterium]|nr:NADP-dependent malic enzyme [Deltaproteobacteria bacterium]